MAFLESAPDRGIRAAHEFAVGTIKGPVRAENQDRAIVASIATGQMKELVIALVCDGMGGLEGGGEAAALAASAFLTHLAVSSETDQEQLLRGAITDANNAVFSKLRGNGGTTLTSVVASRSSIAWCAHVGDSRLYIQKDKLLQQLSHDDTLNGVLSRDHPSSDQSSNPNSLLQFVGMGPDLQPHIDRIEYSPQQYFLLTSDGVHFASTDLLEEVCRNARNLEETVKNLLLLAEALGARDNATAVALQPQLNFRERLFPGGTSVVVSTPAKRLEIWLQNTMARPSADPALDEVSTSTTKPEKNAGGTKKKKGKSATRPRREKRTGEGGKPQLKIEFDPDSND